MVDDWLAHTPKSVIAKNFGLNQTAFKNLPTTDPYILNGTVTNSSVTGLNAELSGNSSFVYRTLQHPSEPVPGNGGTFYKIDSTKFPIATTIAATFVTLKPGGLRELHWHPNVRPVSSSRITLLASSHLISSHPTNLTDYSVLLSTGRRMAVLPQRPRPRYRLHRQRQRAHV
jgi:hypothetical protein